MFITVFIYSLIAGLCTAVGAVVAFFRTRVSKHEKAFLLSAVCGIMIGLVLFDFLPEAIAKGNSRDFIAGIFMSIALVFLVSFIRQKLGAKPNLGYVIMLVLLLQEIPEGMAISLSGAFSLHTAFVVALGLAILNLLEGMTMGVSMSGESKTRIFFNCLFVGSVTPVGTVVGQIATSFLPQYYSLIMGLVAGVSIWVVCSEIWPAARSTSSNLRFIGSILGLGLILLVTLA